MPDADDAIRRKRHRRARPSLKAKQAAAAAAELAKRQRQAAAEEAQAARLAEARAAIEQLIAQDVEDKRREAAARRPQQVIDFCNERGLAPDSIVYHPRYNMVGIPPEVDMQTVECMGFGAGWPTDYGGLGGYGHLRNFIATTWPWVEWNPWFEASLRAIADDDYATCIGETKLKFVNLTGPGSASKSFASGIIACAWFIVDVLRGGMPRTSITLTSTSKAIIKQRVWPVIQRCFHEAVRVESYGPPTRFKWGHMVDSEKMVKALVVDPITGTIMKDSKHSICALAVESGEVSKAVDNIKGRHAERMMLIVDEANSTPQAIFETIPNMLTSVRELIIIVIGNAISRLDPHGLCCEPARGWKSITIDSEQWDTRGVAKWGIGPGVCLHFDGAKSPNVLAGRTEYKHIYSFERWQSVQRQGDEYRNTIQHWSQDRGFWPPDGTQTTIFSEAMFIAHDAMGTQHWMASPTPCAALDPAFGGDNCVLRRGLVGQVVGGKLAVQLLERLLVPFDPDSPDSIEHQIAVFVVEKCKSWRVEPPWFGGDATGTGRGAMAAIQQLWSPRILKVEFGGAASDLPASVNDPRQSHEIYDNRVTELWYATKDILIADQIKGFDAETIRQFCSRFYSYKARRYKAEAKDEMKSRVGYSPDDADAVVVLCEVARRHGLVPAAEASRTHAREDAAAIAALDSTLNTDYTATAAFSEYAEVTY